MGLVQSCQTRLRLAVHLILRRLFLSLSRTSTMELLRYIGTFGLEADGRRAEQREYCEHVREPERPEVEVVEEMEDCWLC